MTRVHCSSYSACILDRLAFNTIIKCKLREGLLIDGCGGVVWAGLAMIWAWMVGVASVLELVFKKLEPIYS